VAAADAMSGARPGARRQMEDNTSPSSRTWSASRAASAACEEAFAVQAAQVRIYVQEDRIDDLSAVNLSAEWPRRFSAEMTFPGKSA